MQRIQGTENKITTDEALQILNKYKGSIKGDFDIEKERDEYLHEKYATSRLHSHSKRL